MFANCNNRIVWGKCPKFKTQQCTACLDPHIPPSPISQKECTAPYLVTKCVWGGGGGVPVKITAVILKLVRTPTLKNPDLHFIHPTEFHPLKAVNLLLDVDRKDNVERATTCGRIAQKRNPSDQRQVKDCDTTIAYNNDENMLTTRRRRKR